MKRFFYAGRDMDGSECLSESPLHRHHEAPMWMPENEKIDFIELVGETTIEKLTGRQITWEDDPIRIAIEVIW